LKFENVGFCGGRKIVDRREKLVEQFKRAAPKLFGTSHSIG